jgi:AraC-like DNA-binding protein
VENPIHLYESKHNERYSLSVHYHEYAQLLYVIEGAGTIIIDDATYDMAQHTAAMIIPYSKHAVSSDSQLTLLVLTFDDTSVHEPMHMEWKAHYFHKSQLLKLNPLHGNELRLLLRRLLFEERREDRFSRWAMRIHLHEIMLLLARAESTSHITDASSLRAERIRHFIDMHYYEAFTSGELAAKMNVSIRHLNATFKEQYRITPMQYLTEVRMSIAKKLLIETDKDIVSICFEIGFESLPTFYRTFKNIIHLSPNQFRQQHQEVQ